MVGIQENRAGKASLNSVTETIRCPFLLKTVAIVVSPRVEAVTGDREKGGIISFFRRIPVRYAMGSSNAKRDQQCSPHNISQSSAKLNARRC